MLLLILTVTKKKTGLLRYILVNNILPQIQYNTAQQNAPSQPSIFRNIPMQNMFNTFSSTTEYLQQQATWHKGGLLEFCIPTFVLKQYCSLLISIVCHLLASGRILPSNYDALK
jgi:hypothetical protein